MGRRLAINVLEVILLCERFCNEDRPIFNMMCGPVVRAITASPMNCGDLELLRRQASQQASGAKNPEYHRLFIDGPSTIEGGIKWIPWTGHPLRQVYGRGALSTIQSPAHLAPEIS